MLTRLRLEEHVDNEELKRPYPEVRDPVLYSRYEIGVTARAGQSACDDVVTRPRLQPQPGA